MSELSNDDKNECQIVQKYDYVLFTSTNENEIVSQAFQDSVCENTDISSQNLLESIQKLLT